MSGNKDGWTRSGRLMTRAWDQYMTEGDYLDFYRYGDIADPRRMRQVQRDLNRHCLDRIDSPNVACNAGRLAILTFISNGGGAGVQYFAVGTGASTPMSTDTQLATEFFRKVPLATTVSGNSVLIATFFGTTEGNTTYSEAGLFGNGATITANSGAMFSHLSYVYAKTVNITLTNDYFIYEN